MHNVAGCSNVMLLLQIFLSLLVATNTRKENDELIPQFRFKEICVLMTCLLHRCRQKNVKINNLHTCRPLWKKIKLATFLSNPPS